jgi:hypothetical protein
MAHQPGIFRPAHNANAPLLAFESKKARLALTWAIASISRQEAEFVQRYLGISVDQVTD